MTINFSILNSFSNEIPQSQPIHSLKPQLFGMTSGTKLIKVNIFYTSNPRKSRFFTKIHV